MRKIGPSAPCPCDSGHEFEVCCLRKVDQAARLTRLGFEAIDHTDAWLDEYYFDEVQEAIAQGFFESDALYLAALNLEAAFAGLVRTNVLEWLLVEGRIRLGRRWLSVLDLLKEQAVADVPSRDLEWIEEIRKHPLSLYRVTRVNPPMLWVDDLSAENNSMHLVDTVASQILSPCDTFAARLIPCEDFWIRSPAFFPFERDQISELLDDLTEWAEPSDDDDIAHHALAAIIRENWLLDFLEPDTTFTDDDDFDDDEDFQPALGHRVELRVDDWDKLEKILANLAIEGNRRLGWLYHDDTGEPNDFILALNPTTDEHRLDLVAPDKFQADDGLEWLFEVAEEAVCYVDEDTITPPDYEDLGDDYDNLPAAERTARAQRAIEAFHKGWADFPNPVLHGKTPRLAVLHPEFRGLVVEILQHYEWLESQKADTETRSSASYEFLWRSVGLDRDDELQRVTENVLAANDP